MADPVTTRPAFLQHFMPRPSVQAYIVLARYCTETIIREAEGYPVIRFPPFMPAIWVTGRGNLQAVYRHRWQVIRLEDSLFLLPPKDYWSALFSDNDLAILSDAGVSVPASAPRRSQWTPDDVRNTMMDTCPCIARSPSGSLLFHPEGMSPDNLRSFIEDGGSVVHSDGDLFLVPPTAIRPAWVSETMMPDAMPADVLHRLAELGVIGLRGSHRAPWWQTPSKSLPMAHRLDVTTRRPSSPDLNLSEFEQRQYERWTNPQAVLDLKQYPESDLFPELQQWLWERLPFVEPMDVRRIVNYLGAAKAATTVEHLNGILKLVHGLMAEIEIRPEIVAQYQKALATNLSLILVPSPQIFSNDIREASDAMIGELVMRGMTPVFVVHTLWEVTSTIAGIRAIRVQMDHTLRNRMREGVYLWSADRQAGVRLPTELADISETDIHTDVVHVNGPRMQVLHATYERMLTTFLLQWNGTRAVKHPRQVAAWPELLKILRTDHAMGTPWTVEEFMRALQPVDPRRARILENIAVRREGGPLSKQAMSKELDTFPNVVGEMETELRALCAEMNWVVYERTGAAGDIERGWQRRHTLKGLKTQAELHGWGVKRMIWEMKKTGLKVDAVLLKNMTTPGGGERRTTIEMARQLNFRSPTTAYDREARLEALCTELHWPMVAPPQQSRSNAMVAGHRARQAFDELWKKATSNNWAREEFLRKLKKSDAARAIVIRNLTEGFDGRRLSPAGLHKRFALDRQVVVNWEDAFEPMCQGRGWPVLQRPDGTSRHAERVAAGQGLSDRVRALQNEAQVARMDMGSFAERLRGLDPVRGTVWDRVVHPSEKPATSRELADELNVPKSNLCKYAAELREFSREMGWSPAAPNTSPIGANSKGGVVFAPDADQMDEQQKSLAPKSGGFDEVTVKVEPLVTPADGPQVAMDLPGASLDDQPLPICEGRPMISPDEWKKFQTPPTTTRPHSVSTDNTSPADGTGDAVDEYPALDPVVEHVELSEDLAPPVSLASTPLPRLTLDPATVGILLVAGFLAAIDGPLPFGDAAAASLLGARMATY